MELLSIDRAEFCPFRPAAIFLRIQKAPPPTGHPAGGGSKAFFMVWEAILLFDIKHASTYDPTVTYISTRI